MALYTVVNGNTINSQDINQVVNDLQRPAGTQETGNYLIAGSGFSGNVVSTWVVFRSRVSSPVSVAVDTSVAAPSGNLNSPSTAFITSTGCQITANQNANNASSRCAGVYTVSY